MKPGDRIAAVMNHTGKLVVATVTSMHGISYPRMHSISTPAPDGRKDEFRSVTILGKVVDPNSLDTTLAAQAEPEPIAELTAEHDELISEIGGLPDNGPAERAKRTELYGKTDALEARIFATRSSSTDGVIWKLRHLARYLNVDPDAKEWDWEHEILGSIIDDIKALTSPNAKPTRVAA